MGDNIPMNREPKRRKPEGELILGMKIAAPKEGDTISFERGEDGNLVLVHNSRQYRVPTPPSDCRQDVIILRWGKDGPCGEAGTFHRSEPVSLCTKTPLGFGDGIWTPLREAA